MPAKRTSFAEALAEVWADPQARSFAVFVFVSMLAYSAQDLILEPFAGTVFGLTPGESTKLSGLQHGGVLAGMLLVGLSGPVLGARRAVPMRLWMIGGCAVSAAALASLAFGALAGPDFPLGAAVFVLGLGNGAFAVAAIGSMMALAGSGPGGREGVRMGLWGAAQAVAFGLGGFAGTAAIDLAGLLIEPPGAAYAAVFLGEAALFLVSGVLAARLSGAGRAQGSRRRRQEAAVRREWLPAVPELEGSAR